MHASREGSTSFGMVSIWPTVKVIYSTWQGNSEISELWPKPKDNFLNGKIKHIKHTWNGIIFIDVHVTNLPSSKIKISYCIRFPYI